MLNRQFPVAEDILDPAHIDVRHRPNAAILGIFGGGREVL